MTFARVYEGRSPVEGAFGFYLSNHPMMKEPKSRPLAILHNIANFVDWTPAGIISGIARCIFLAMMIYNAPPPDKETKNWLIIEATRGVTSAFGLGFLWAVPDILFTIHDKLATNQASARRHFLS